MLFYILHDLCNLTVGCLCGRVCNSVIYHCPVKMNHKFQKKYLLIQGSCIILMLQARLLQLTDRCIQSAGHQRFDTQYTAAGRSCPVETCIQIILLIAVRANEFIRYINDNPLILTILLYLRTMHLACMYKHNIIGLQTIGAPIYMICNISFNQNQKLMEGMIMVSKIS